jgi:hypothetical protein
MTLLEVTCPEVTSQEVTLFSRAFFLTRVVVQNVPFLFVIRFTASDYSFGIFWSLCCLSFDWRLLIIPFVSSCKGTFCTTTLVRKKRGKITSLPVTSLPVKCLTSLPDTCLPVALFPVAHLSQINKSTGKKGREKKDGEKSKGKSHVTSGHFGQACAMVRSSANTTWTMPIYYWCEYMVGIKVPIPMQNPGAQTYSWLLVMLQWRS